MLTDVRDLYCMVVLVMRKLELACRASSLSGVETNASQLQAAQTPPAKQCIHLSLLCISLIILTSTINYTLKLSAMQSGISGKVIPSRKLLTKLTLNPSLCRTPRRLRSLPLLPLLPLLPPHHHPKRTTRSPPTYLLHLHQYQCPTAKPLLHLPPLPQGNPPTQNPIIPTAPPLSATEQRQQCWWWR